MFPGTIASSAIPAAKTMAETIIVAAFGETRDSRFFIKFAQPSNASVNTGANRSKPMTAGRSLCTAKHQYPAGSKRTLELCP